ncbi:hypothetical protein GGI43DRAFT_91436 [Trichoderma evansii]
MRVENTLGGLNIINTCKFPIFDHTATSCTDVYVSNYLYFSSSMRQSSICHYDSHHPFSLQNSLSSFALVIRLLFKISLELCSFQFFNPILTTIMDSASHSLHRRLPTDDDDFATLLCLVCSTAVFVCVVAILAVAMVHNRPTEKIRQRNYDIQRMSFQNEDRDRGSSSGVSWPGFYV